MTQGSSHCQSCSQGWAIWMPHISLACIRIQTCVLRASASLSIHQLLQQSCP